MIIGVTGYYCSGKDIVAELLKEKGFIHISLSDLIGEAAEKAGMKDSRETRINYGNELRKKHGTGVLSQWAVQKIQPGKKYVLSSFRNPGEVEVLKTQPNFILINVTAALEIRWERMKAGTKIERGHGFQTFEEFKENEKQESEGTDPTAQQLNAVRKMADITIENNGTVEELKEKLHKLIESRKAY